MILHSQSAGMRNPRAEAALDKEFLAGAEQHGRSLGNPPVFDGVGL